MLATDRGGAVAGAAGTGGVSTSGTSGAFSMLEAEETEQCVKEEKYHGSFRVYTGVGCKDGAGTHLLMFSPTVYSEAY